MNTNLSMKLVKVKSERLFALVLIVMIFGAAFSQSRAFAGEEQFKWGGGKFSAEDAVAMFGAQSEEISMNEARAYMLELVNADRAALKLQPLVLDDYATKAAQWHADDMAVKRFISHWNTDGFTPTMRYTTGGGRDGVTENVTYFECGVRVFLTKKVVEYLQSQFMGSPGHRENLLRPEHNKLGVGIGFALFQDGSCVFTCNQTFVGDYGEIESLPPSILLGAPITVSGTLDVKRVDFRYIGLGWSPLPQPIAPQVLNAYLQGGTDPGSYNLFTPKGNEPPSGTVPVDDVVQWDKTTGKYSVAIDLSKPLPGTPMPPNGAGPGTPGVYFIFVWATLKKDLIPSGWANRDDYYFKAGVWTLGGVK